MGSGAFALSGRLFWNGSHCLHCRPQQNMLLRMGSRGLGFAYKAIQRPITSTKSHSVRSSSSDSNLHDRIILTKGLLPTPRGLFPTLAMRKTISSTVIETCREKLDASTRAGLIEELVVQAAMSALLNDQLATIVVRRALHVSHVHHGLGPTQAPWPHAFSTLQPWLVRGKSYNFRGSEPFSIKIP